MIRLTDFEKKTSDPVRVTCASAPSGDIPDYEIRSFHPLTQLIGFGKYMNRDAGNVRLRDQTSLYRRNAGVMVELHRKGVKYHEAHC